MRIVLNCVSSCGVLRSEIKSGCICIYMRSVGILPLLKRLCINAINSREVLLLEKLSSIYSENLPVMLTRY